MARRWLRSALPLPLLLFAVPACCLRVPRDEAVDLVALAPNESLQDSASPRQHPRGQVLRRLEEEEGEGGVHCHGGSYTQADLKCEEGAVWIVTENKKRSVPRWIQENSPICVQKLRPCHASNFWVGRMLAVYDYLHKNPAVTHAIVTDDDIVVNPLWWSEIMERFNSATDAMVARVGAPSAKKAAPREPRVLISTEQTCWTGQICDVAWAQEWLQRVRRATGNDRIKSFLNSQYMGERLGVLRLLEAMVATGLHDDQAALHDVVARYPNNFTIDYEERVFLSLARGLVPVREGFVGGSTVCNFGGSSTQMCEPLKHGVEWGECTMQSNRSLVSVIDNKGKWMPPPLVIHLNSLAMRQAKTGKNCKAVIAEAENRTVRQLQSKTIL